MINFTPTFGIRDTSKNVRDFVKNNDSVFWSILKPLLPWIIGLHLLDSLVTAFFYSGEGDRKFEFGSLVAAYFYTCLVISWHRVVLKGSDNFVPMNPFKPKKNELIYLGMGILWGVCVFVSGLSSGLLMKLNVALGAIAFIFSILLILYFAFKFVFYLPAKAVESHISLKDSFYLTKGYFWKFAGSSFLAPLILFIVSIVYGFLSLFLVGLIIQFSEGIANSDFFGHLIGFILLLPMIIYIYPRLYVIGVTVLSNYYQHAVQNKNIPSQMTSK